jgi:hypothetical protein
MPDPNDGLVGILVRARCAKQTNSAVQVSSHSTTSKYVKALLLKLPTLLDALQSRSPTLWDSRVASRRFESTNEILNTMDGTTEPFITKCRHTANTIPPPPLVASSNTCQSQVYSQWTEKYSTSIYKGSLCPITDMVGLLLSSGQCSCACSHGQPSLILRAGSKLAAPTLFDHLDGSASRTSQSQCILRTTWLIDWGGIHANALPSIPGHFHEGEFGSGSSDKPEHTGGCLWHVAETEVMASCLAQLSPPQHGSGTPYMEKWSKLRVFELPIVHPDTHVGVSTPTRFCDLHVFYKSSNQVGEFERWALSASMDFGATNPCVGGRLKRAPDKALWWRVQGVEEATIPPQRALQARDDQPVVNINTYERVSLKVLYVSDAATISVAFPMFTYVVFPSVSFVMVLLVFLVVSYVYFPNLLRQLLLCFPCLIAIPAGTVTSLLSELSHQHCAAASHIKPSAPPPPPPSRPDPQPYPSTPYQSSIRNISAPPPPPPPRPETQPYPTGPYQSKIRSA